MKKNTRDRYRHEIHSYQISSLNSTSFERKKKHYSPQICLFCFSQMKLSLDLRFGMNVFHVYTYL